MPRPALALLVVALPALAGHVPPADDLVRSVEVVTVRKGRDGGTTWFHPRGCTLPDGTVVWTLQDITGSDVFGPVHWTASRDDGKTWTDPQPVPGLGRKKLPGGVEAGVCDVVPEYHPTTGTVLAIGHTVNHKGGRFYKDQPPRHPVFAVRAKDGTWSDARKLEWDDPRGAYIYTCGCAQRATLPDGDVLVPVSFGPTPNAARSVSTLLCGFDGRTLTVKKVGTELKGKVGRGLLEPSIAAFGGRFYLTIRAEDGKGYVSPSDDGLAWGEPKAWAWDDGTPVAMSTTQQRWLPHSDGLYLVYTRRDDSNVNVARWRAPLFLARVDPATMRLVRATERVAVPLVGDGVREPAKVAHLGNFHTQAVTADESWVTVGEVIPTTWRGDLLLARVRWAKPNAFAPRPRRPGPSAVPSEPSRRDRNSTDRRGLPAWAPRWDEGARRRSVSCSVIGDGCGQI
jgi:hypothetical protein